MQLRPEVSDNENDNKPFFQKYLMIDPQKSNKIIFWENLLWVVILTQFVLFPFTVCLTIDDIFGDTWQVEYFIDVVWLINIFVCFITAKEIDDHMEVRWVRIASSYVSSDFLFDFISCAPVGLM